MSSGKAKLIVPTLVIGALVAPIIFFKIFVKEGDVGEVMSMTGRIPFWGDLLTYGFPEKPLIWLWIYAHSPFPQFSQHSFLSRFHDTQYLFTGIAQSGDIGSTGLFLQYGICVQGLVQRKRNHY